MYSARFFSAIYLFTTRFFSVGAQNSTLQTSPRYMDDSTFDIDSPNLDWVQLALLIYAAIAVLYFLER